MVDIEVTIIEGETVRDINTKLHELGVLRDGEAIQKELEGYLFPDTYRFFAQSSAEDVVEKMRAHFVEKTGYELPLTDEQKEVLIMASLIEKEVPRSDDRFLVSGILWKRFSIDMPLQIDATVCYAKYETSVGCTPLKRSDFSVDSRFNTYKYFGLPPAPISNPGLTAIEAALNPKKSEYWYYLSDPDTKRTVFAATLDEHNDNRAIYLGL